MTFGSFAARSLSLILVLPLVLIRLSAEEVVVWYLFSTIIGLQVLADLGFTPTFSRIISYGMGGLTVDELKNVKDIAVIEQANVREPNWDTIEQVCATMQTIYRRLTLISISLLVTFGTWAVFKPISTIADSSSAWIAWGVILVTATFTFLGNNYNSYLQGLNKIALLRRWETLTSLAAIVSSFVVLWLGGGLLALVVTNQFWLVINIVRNRWLCRSIEKGKFREFRFNKTNLAVFNITWASAWRTGLGAFMSYGVVQMSVVIYAQIGTASGVASYLLGVRLIQTIGQFSQAPFYSKLPIMAKLFSEGNITQQIKIAKRGMILAYWSYTVGFVGLGIIGAPLLKSISSNVEFVNPLLWGLMGLGMFAERYGAMHIQLYSITNHIISHIANGVSGVIYLAVSLTLFDRFGVYAFPIGTLAAYLGFYCWYSAMHSYKTFRITFWNFEKYTMIPSLLFLTLYFIITTIAPLKNFMLF